ncbi:hypothetical protein C8R43DRAFT_1121189 [Mycena crocata]|nr:hypothetical protein C8R43DRAFT_1121189 [Mycena crocata]
MSSSTSTSRVPANTEESAAVDMPMPRAGIEPETCPRRGSRREHRSGIRQDEGRVKHAAEQRRVVDADYRERCRKKEFIKKFGRRAFAEHYLPLHDVYGPYITGHRFVTTGEADKEDCITDAKKVRRAKAKRARVRAAKEEEARTHPAE